MNCEPGPEQTEVGVDSGPALNSTAAICMSKTPFLFVPSLATRMGKCSLANLAASHLQIHFPLNPVTYSLGLAIDGNDG